MANQEQLEILKQGVQAWNQWRQGYPDIIRPDLRNADLTGADLSYAHLNGADLWEADLRSANLTGATLSDATLTGADLKEAIVGWTIFVGVDLSKVKNLETVMHGGPSSIGIDTIYRSGGTIPEAFLKGLVFLTPFLSTCIRLLVSPLTTIPALSATPARMMHSPGACMLIYRATMCAAGLRLKT
jgi:uncharacterized protein YjbI with pentapeptide repeats